MKLNEITTEQLFKTTYMTYKRMFDFENGTSYAKQHYEMQKINKTIYKLHTHDTHNAQTEIASTTHDTTESTSYERIETNNGQQRDIIGNYNDNRVMIKKTLNHLNAMKRSMSISQQSNDEKTRLTHENIMYRELLNLELSIRTMNKNIIENNE